MPNGLPEGPTTVILETSSGLVATLDIHVLAERPFGPPNAVISWGGATPAPLFPTSDDDVQTPPLLEDTPFSHLPAPELGPGCTEHWEYPGFLGMNGTCSTVNDTQSENYIVFCPDSTTFTNFPVLVNLDVGASTFAMEVDRDDDGVFEVQYTGVFLPPVDVLIEDQDGRQLKFTNQHCGNCEPICAL